ncbi:T9SS type A sorting domain-containing protein [Phaeocystidibacter luteus]|uniref:T9SS type A sorting domain-containing protein n=1 Tax=Phaeocystidibacter luteus TaxID=911197 RepID=A0A6N6RCZ4_9FLAO|nr:T9SS type A sorting domain-containing protein [Phaeocystidibacter luteus]KAB2805476.1 T9SS type A sorting domain-containing protein [Phaeocystidibacter luteus]
MNKFLSVCSFVLLLLFSLQSFGTHTHVGSAALTYEYVGNNRFVFTLQTVSFCPHAMSSYPIHSSVTLTDGTVLSLDTSFFLSPGCAMPCGADTTGNPEAVLAIYKSGQILVSKPPAGGTTFIFVSTGLRPSVPTNVGSTTSLYVTATMYPEGYPRSSAQVDIASQDEAFEPSTPITIRMPSFSLQGDSLHRELAPSLLNTGMPHTYTGSLSFQAPVDGFVNYDNLTGELTSSGLPANVYNYIAQKVQSFSPFGLSSSIHWERGARAFTSYTAPTTTAQLKVSHDPSLQVTSNPDSTFITLYVNRGDTAELDFNLFTTVGTTIEYEHTIYGSNGSDVDVYTKPGFVNPSPFIPQIRFSIAYQPDSTSQSMSTVMLTAHDNACPTLPHYVQVNLVTSSIPMPVPDTVYGCLSGDVILNTSVSGGDWVPNDSIQKLGATTYRHTVNGSKLLIYYVNGVPVQSAWVIGANLPNPTFGTVNGGPGLTNANQFLGADWYYFDVLVDSNILVLPSTSAWGNYQPMAYTGQCVKWGPLSAYQRPNSVITQFMKDKLATAYETLPVGTQISWEVEKDSPGNLWPQSLIFPGAHGVGQFAIEVDSSGVVIYSDTTEAFGPYAKRMTFPHAYEGINMLWSNGRSFKFTATVVGGDMEVPVGDLYRNGEAYGGFLHKNNTNLPDSSWYFMPFVLQTYSGVGVDEFSRAEWSVYPNPASDFLQVEGIDEIQHFTIINQFGQIVLSGEVSDKAISLADLPGGIYFIQIDDQVERFVKVRN